jgi:hypothetical protein
MMKNLLLLVLLYTTFLTNAQEREVDLVMQNGDKRTITTKLVFFEVSTVFPNTSKSFIKGLENGKKVKINISEIKKIKIKWGEEYVVLRNVKSGVTSYYIGFFITKNTFKLFKTYIHDHQSYGFGQPASINKVTTVRYYVVEEDSIRALNAKKDSEKLAEGCSIFKDYLMNRKKKRIKESEIEETFRLYDDKCS